MANGSQQAWYLLLVRKSLIDKKNILLSVQINSRPFWINFSFIYEKINSNSIFKV